MNSQPKQYGIGWLKFYVNWRFPLGFIFGALSILGELANASESGYLGVPIFLFFLAIDISLYIYRIVVYSNMKRMTEKSYSMNMVLLFVETLYLSISNTLGRSNGEAGMTFVVSLITASLVWLLPNYIYFSHRRYLFTGRNTLSEISRNEAQLASSLIDSNVPRNETKFICDSCGKYSSGWYQSCPNCGAIGRMRRSEEQDSSQASSKAEDPAVKIIEPNVGEEEPQVGAAIRFCRFCGQKLEPQAKFCAYCGAKMEQ